MDSDPILMAGAVGTVPCALSDLIVHAIQSWQRKRAGVIHEPFLGPFGRIVVSIIVNYPLCTAFAYLYDVIGTRAQDAYLMGGVLWLTLSVPMLMTSRGFDDIQKRILASRILGWLFKIAAASASAAYFIH